MKSLPWFTVTFKDRTQGHFQARNIIAAQQYCIHHHPDFITVFRSDVYKP